MPNQDHPIDLHHLVYSPMQDDTSSPLLPLVPDAAIQESHSHSAYEQACTITAWQQLYDQIQPGKFDGSLHEVWLNGVQFFKEYTNLAVRQSCMVWPNALWIGLPINNKQLGKIGGTFIESGQVALRHGNQEFELTTPEQYTIMGTVLSWDCLLKAAEKEEIDSQWLNRLLANDILQVNQYTKRQFCHFLNHCLQLSHQQPKQLQCVGTQKVLYHHLVTSALRLLTSAKPQPTKISRSRLNYKRLVDRARDYLLDHHYEVISLTELCYYLHVSSRTLHNSFQTILGMSPLRYLKIIRLNAVRRELQSPYSGYATIQDAAMNWGFWHMSQFAQDYQQLFNEKPSQTRLNQRKRSAFYP